MTKQDFTLIYYGVKQYPKGEPEHLFEAKIKGREFSTFDFVLSQGYAVIRGSKNFLNDLTSDEQKIIAEAAAEVAKKGK